ncbi:MAG: adenosylcobinamide-GDP ribazoletransferase [Actinomycetota bacterium]|nr:adenosylcobinamide-GDP ribazoletransferase [Actinomycetota bacterium]
MTATGGRGLLEATGFLTAVGSARAPTPAALGWFGVVGAVLGGALGLGWLGAAELWPPAVAAVLVVVANLALTGMLHLDGLADAADGLLPPVERARRLAIMATPETGAFGVTAVAACLLLQVVALTAIDPAPVLVAALFAASRAGMAVVVATLPYARGDGLASAMRGGRPIAAFASLAAALAGATLWEPLAGPVSVACGLLAGAGVVALAMRRLGGFTGDVVGAAGVIAETVGLTVAAARW